MMTDEMDERYVVGQTAVADGKQVVVFTAWSDGTTHAGYMKKRTRRGAKRCAARLQGLAQALDALGR